MSNNNELRDRRKTGTNLSTCADEFTADLSQALKPEKNKERNHDSTQTEKGHRPILSVFSQSTLAIFWKWVSTAEPGKFEFHLCVWRSFVTFIIFTFKRNLDAVDGMPVYVCFPVK